MARAAARGRALGSIARSALARATVGLAVTAPAAHAAEPVPTLLLPNAVAIEAGSGQAAVGALFGGGDAPTFSGTLRATAGITDRLAVTGGLQEPFGGLFLGLRYNVVQTDAIRVAPFVFGGVNDDLVVLPGTAALDALGAGMGVALEGGWPTTRLDLSLPLVVTGVDPVANPLYAPLALGSAGVTVNVTPRHAVRVGIETLGSAALGVRYARERWYAQGTALYSLLQGRPLVAGEVGLRF